MKNSKNLLQIAQKYFPAGVNSPVRAFNGVGGNPVFIKSGKGPYLIDADDNHYIDYVCSWGPLILGHAHPFVIEKIMSAAKNGVTFGASTEIEIELAQKISTFMPSMEMLRFVSSGTEAGMSVIRLARGYTKRNKILKFSGCYHGHTDSLLVAAGSGGLTFGSPSSAGVLASTAQETLVAEFNNLEQVQRLFLKHSDEIAAVIVEPIAANMNLVLPQPGFLQGLRQLCDRYESLLIFDEVVTGFRVGLGGAQGHYQIKPDLTMLGKIIGGGLPAAAYGGRKEIMAHISPLGPVYQAGTLSGNPLAMTAGVATLELLASEHFYTNLNKKTSEFVAALNQCAQAADYPFYAQSFASMFGMYFSEQKTFSNECSVKAVDSDAFKYFFHGMLAEGVYFAPSAFEIGFVSAMHTQKEFEKTLQAAEKIFKDMKKSMSLSQVQQA